MSGVLPAAATCSLISAKVSYRKSDGLADARQYELWEQICNKRDECDRAIKRIPGMAFFSTVAAIERKVKKGCTNEDTDDEGDEKSRATNSKLLISMQYPTGWQFSLKTEGMFPQCQFTPPC